MSQVFKHMRAWMILGGALSVTAPIQFSAAQGIGDVESAITRGSQFDDARQISRQQQQRQTVGDTLPGEAGVFILDKNEIFSIGAVGGIGHSTNPTRTLDLEPDNSIYGTLAVSAGVNTVINESFNAGLNFVASGTEYGDSAAPNFRNLLLSGYAGKDVFNKFMFVSLGFSIGSNFNGSFGDSTGFYGVNASAAKVIPIDKRTILQVSLGASRNWSDNSEQNNTTVGPTIDIIWAASQNWRFTGAINYNFRIYSDFFEDVTLTTRKDHQLTIGANAAYQISPRLEVTAGLSYTRQDSTFFLSDFEEVNSGLNIRAVHRF